MRSISLFIVCLILVTSCKTQPKPKTTVNIRNSPVSRESLGSAKIVAYRFALPGDGSEQPVESGFSLFNEEGQLNLEQLEKLKVKEAILNSDQTEKFLDAVYSEEERTSAAACYDPHHIFLFYDDSDTLINVVEICFSCYNLHAFPILEESIWRKHDFRALALLCEEIGIGMTFGSAEDFIRMHDERDSI